MELQEIQSFIEQNKENDEVKAYLQGFKQVSVDEVQNLVGQDENFKKWFDSERDKHFGKSLETWKQNNLEKLVDEKVKKLYPEETPEQKELRKLRQEIEQERQARLRESLKNKALGEATSKQLPADLAEFFIGDDEETTLKNLDFFSKAWQNALKSAVDERFKEAGRDPQFNHNQKPSTLDQQIIEAEQKGDFKAARMLKLQKLAELEQK